MLSWLDPEMTTWNDRELLAGRLRSP